jgi:hypothetical protein
MRLQGGDVEYSVFLQHQLALNIVEASDLDRIRGVDEMAEYGMAIAADTTSMMPWIDEVHAIRWPYTKGWFDACTLLCVCHQSE